MVQFWLSNDVSLSVGNGVIIMSDWPAPRRCSAQCSDFNVYSLLILSSQMGLYGEDR